MLSILNLSEEVSFSARIRLVVAMRLQEQHSSFQLRTSSHMPSVLMNVAHGSFHKFREGNALSIFANFILRSSWMNRHNSRQSCNLDELINQSEPIRNFASHLRNVALWESLLGLRRVSEIAMFGQGGLRFQNKQGWVSQGHD
jgi:hypothetical protein